MSDRPDINAIFDRIAKRDFTDEDIQTLRQSVAIAGNAQGSTIVTGDDNILGDNNTVQIGKYNINIAEGRNIEIGDTIYQGTDAETIRSILLEVLTDKIVIDSTFSRLFGKSESSDVDWDWAIKLLKQKQLPEIRKRLTDTLGRDRILMDVSIEEQQNWVNRSPLAADRILQINGKDCGTLDANKMLIETFGRDDIEGKLLILGAPGAGKTTALLSLAEQLVYGAISQPRTVIPVIFELSTWQNDNQSIESWLIEQLYDLHGGNRKSKLYEQWLERQVLLPLLDGLDELGLERQKKCTQKLNEFAEHYPQLVVCCRVKEFEAVDIKLRNLRGAVCLQSLSDPQIQDYLGSLKRPELWGAIQTTPSLQAMLEPTTEGDPGLLRVPLFVKLVADVYDPQQPISSKADLLDKYIDRQLSFDKREFDRRKELNEYKWSYKTSKLEPCPNKTRSNLYWLAEKMQANDQVEFLIEKMQVNCLKSRLEEIIYSLFVGLFFALYVGITIGLAVFVIAPIENISVAGIVSMGLGVFFGFSFGLWAFLTVGQSRTIISVEKLNLSNKEILRSFCLAISIGFVSWLIINITFPWISTERYSIQLILALALPLVMAFNTSSSELQETTRPNEGIWRSFGNAWKVSLVGSIWLGLSAFVMKREILKSLYSSGLERSPTLPVLSTIKIVFSCALAGIFVGLILGGTALIQHLSLRIVLWQSGLPWNFKQFLKYCVERRLLLRVGGSYRFLHRELLDHFAQSNR
jgi:hypothetical protein